MQTQNMQTINNFQFNLNHSKSKQSDYLFVLFTLFFVLFLFFFSFRGVTVGTDTSAYYNMFENRNVSDASLNKEPLFWILVDITKLLNLDFTFLLSMMGILCLLGFFVIIKNYSINTFLSLFLFLCLGIYTSSYNGMRQFMALSFFLLSIDSMIKNNPIQYFVYWFFAVICHNSAIILLPFYLIKFIKVNWKTTIIFSCLSIVTIFLLPGLVQFVSKFTNRDYYNYYLESNIFTSSVSIYNVLYLLALIIIFAWLWYIRNEITNQKDLKMYNIYLTLFFVDVCIRFISTFSGFFTLVNRLTIYFFWSLILIIPYTIMHFPFNKLKRLYINAIYIVGLSYFLISALFNKSNNVIPYALFFYPNQIGFWIALLFIFIDIVLISIYSEKLRSKGYNYERKINECYHSSF